MAPPISQEWLKLELSNFVCKEIVPRLAKRLTNHPQKGRGYVHVTINTCATVELEKNIATACCTLAEINNAVDDEPLFISPSTVDASAAIY